MQRRNRSILVAGGAGFIGSHLCEALLADGHHVVCFDNLRTGTRANVHALDHEPRFDFVQGDIVAPVPKSLKSLKPSLIFNLACPASPPHYQADPVHTLLTSVVGTHSLLSMAERTGARFVFTSTSEVYGDPVVHPQTEDYWGHVNPIGPRACYDEGKRAAETLSADFARAGRVDVRVARIFNTYGPRMQRDDGRVVSNMICQALSGADITIYGDGSQTRSFCYVSDLVGGLMRLAEVTGRLAGPVNLGNPAEMTVAELAETVLALTGSRSALVRRPLPVDDPRRRKPDISLARRVLGWQPSVDLKAGLQATITYFARLLPEPGRMSAEASRPRTAATL